MKASNIRFLPKNTYFEKIFCKSRIHSPFTAMANTGIVCFFDGRLKNRALSFEICLKKVLINQKFYLTYFVRVIKLLKIWGQI